MLERNVSREKNMEKLLKIESLVGVRWGENYLDR